jgi:hypothetical protein
MRMKRTLLLLSRLEFDPVQCKGVCLAKPKRAWPGPHRRQTVNGERVRASGSEVPLYLVGWACCTCLLAGVQ